MLYYIASGFLISEILPFIPQCYMISNGIVQFIIYNVVILMKKCSKTPPVIDSLI